uniref:Uncharacterized protein n=1 Tax=Plectus sambesii TaxID=2011161 RepID=A0A914UYS6_9BILA
MLRRKRSVSCGGNGQPLCHVSSTDSQPDIVEWDELKLSIQRITSTSSVSSEPTKLPLQRSQTSVKLTPKVARQMGTSQDDKEFMNIVRAKSPSLISASRSQNGLSSSVDRPIDFIFREAQDNEFRVRSYSDAKEVRYHTKYNLPIEVNDRFVVRGRSQAINEQDKNKIETWFSIQKVCANLGFI